MAEKRNRLKDMYERSKRENAMRPMTTPAKAFSNAMGWEPLSKNALALDNAQQLGTDLSQAIFGKLPTNTEQLLSPDYADSVASMIPMAGMVSLGYAKSGAASYHPEAKKIADAFKRETGVPIEHAGLKQAGVEVRNLQRKSGNLHGDIELDPFSKEQNKMIDRFEKLTTKSSKYGYHSTPMGNIESIKNSGLLINPPKRMQSSSGSAVSLAANPDIADLYNLSGGNAMLRVNTKKLKGAGHHLDYDLLQPGAATTKKDISPDLIEIKSGNKWVPINQYL